MQAAWTYQIDARGAPQDEIVALECLPTRKPYVELRGEAPGACRSSSGGRAAILGRRQTPQSAVVKFRACAEAGPFRVMAAFLPLPPPVSVSVQKFSLRRGVCRRWRMLLRLLLIRTDSTSPAVEHPRPRASSSRGPTRPPRIL